MPWRDEPTFYHVLVSEIMLQQTQVSRVLAKFDEFLTVFPTVTSLASASLADVLKVWQGLGYNRRAKYLHDTAKQIVRDGEPQTIDGLKALPGIGHNTAAAIMNYVHEIPTPFIETNIRTVYFHHFFPDESGITDKTVLALVEQTMDRSHPREWFWALMDYGTSLKSQGYGRIDASKHYKKQSPLHGSVREARGKIIALLAVRDTPVDLLERTFAGNAHYARAYEGLLRDGLIERRDGVAHLTK